MTINSRPRIWLTPASLAAIKARAAASDDRWLKLKAVADRPADWGNGIIGPALAYQVTGNAAYAAKAWSLMQQSMAAGLQQITPDSGLQAHNYLPASAIVFDWLHDWLQPAQLAALKTDMEACCDWVWPETNPSRKGQWGVDADASGNNYHHSFMLTWMTGLALAGESAKAQGYLDNARRRWDTEVVPYLTTIAAGGLLAEGMAYGVASMGWMCWYLMAHLSATGEDLIAATPWLGDAATALLHMTNPALTEMVPLGDLAAGPVTDRVRRPMLCLSSHYPRCAGWLDAVTPNRNQEALNQWEEFLWYTPAGVVPPAPSTVMIALGTGILSSRTDWTKNAVQMVLNAGSTRESHQDRAQGAVLVSRDNQWLVGTAKLQSHSGIDQSALDWTTLTVNGAEQTWTQDGCRILRQEETPQYTYAMADLTAAYNNQLGAFIREILFLKPSSPGGSAFLLIADGYVPISPSSTVTWHLNTPVQPTILGSAFQAGPLFGNVIEPFPVPLSRQTVKLAPDQAIPTYRVDVPGDATGHFLVALEAVAVAGPLLSHLGEAALVNDSVQGIRCGSAFGAWLTGGRSTWAYSSPGAGPHYLIGTPQTEYQTPAGTVTSTACGLLLFPGPAVGQPVKITQGSVPVPPPPPPPLVKTFAVSGTLTSQPDGSLVGMVTLKPQPMGQQEPPAPILGLFGPKDGS